MGQNSSIRECPIKPSILKRVVQCFSRGTKRPLSSPGPSNTGPAKSLDSFCKRIPVERRIRRKAHIFAELRIEFFQHTGAGSDIGGETLHVDRYPTALHVQDDRD